MDLKDFQVDGESIWEKLDELGKNSKSILFIINFEANQAYLIPPEKASSLGVFYKTRNFSNVNRGNSIAKVPKLEINPIDLNTYKKAFDRVQYYLNRGDSYLINLTFSTAIDFNLPLTEILKRINSPYALCFSNRFLVFSPETFLRIEENKISSYPMKGTLSVEKKLLENNPDLLSQGLEKILNNPKEAAEHATMVDMIRNDLSRIAKEVRIINYRYPDYIHTLEKVLIQLSTQIEGKLPKKPLFLGQILKNQLPAGSISGAPKSKTIEIIKEVENYSRGFYSGVFGIFDGKSLDSAIMIRYIEKKGEKLFYKSGGGITSQSLMEEEYQELIQKIYVPTI